jgi:hypothetical protein
VERSVAARRRGVGMLTNMSMVHKRANGFDVLLITKGLTMLFCLGILQAASKNRL